MKVLELKPIKLKLKRFNIQTEKEFSECILSGDKNCFSAIYEYFYKTLVNSLRRSFNEDEAKDIVQEYLICLYEKKLEKFVPEKSPLDFYIRRTFNNFLIDYTRFKKTKKERFVVNLGEKVLTDELLYQNYKEEILESSLFNLDDEQLIKVVNIFRACDELFDDDTKRLFMLVFIETSDKKDFYDYIKYKVRFTDEIILTLKSTAYQYFIRKYKTMILKKLIEYNVIKEFPKTESLKRGRRKSQ